MIKGKWPFWEIFKHKENRAIVCIAQTYNEKTIFLYPKNNYTKSLVICMDIQSKILVFITGKTKRCKWV